MTDRTVSVALQLKLTSWSAQWRTAGQTAKKHMTDLEAHARKNRAAFDDSARAAGGIGLAAGVGVGVAVKRFADFDKAMSNVRAATHETAGGMQLLRDAALDAGKRTAFSATEAANAIENLAKAGVSTADILSGGLKGALDLAAAGQIDVAVAAETAATAMKVFKLRGQDIPHVADLLAAAAGKAQGEVTDMAAALNQSALVAAQMGLSIEETTGTLAAFADAGLLGSDAGTSFKTMLLRLANPSKEAAATLEDIGVSAHTAQGEFVGIAPLAEQLRKKLSGLSQQQRDAALATIFGSDAIRAAAVLYNNGAAGIAKWTANVNDAGFAAETAAIKQDNLRGDVEKFGGSLETAFIQGGSKANSVLRGLTQTATAAVDEFGEMPDAVQSGVVALGGVVAVGGLAAAGLLKATTAASDAKDAWQNLGRTGRGLTLAMGGVGVALAAAAVVYSVFAKRNAEAKQEAEDLRTTLDEQTGAITQNTRATVAKKLADSGVAQSAKDMGLSLRTVTDAALGNDTALRSLVQQLDQVIAGETMHMVAGNRAATMLSQEGQAAAALKDQLLGTNRALTDAQQTQRLAAEGAEENKTAQEIQAAAVKTSNTAFREQKQSLDEVIESMHRASGLALSLSGAQIEFQAAIDDAAEAIKENGRSLDINTEKGRANRAALNDIAEAANDQTDALLTSGKSHETVAKSAQTARAEFVKVAIRMGLNKTQAKALAQALIDIPDSASTIIKTNAPAAKAAVVDYRKNGLGAIPGVVPTLIQPRGVLAAKQTLADYRRNGLEAIPSTVPTQVRTVGVEQAKRSITGFSTHVDKTLGGIADEAVRVSLSFLPFTRNAPGGRTPARHATGGPVFGEGTATSDSIPAMLSDGEHVITAREVQGAGGHGAIERMRREWAGYAQGGTVGLRAAAPSVHVIEHTASTIARAVGREIAKERSKGFGGPPGNVRSFRGHRLNERTIAMVLAAERILGSAFRITQGSYSTRVAASAGTHAGGGVLDTNGPGGWGRSVGALRRVGLAAWHRTPSQGPWPSHIHAVAIGDPTASPAAKRQVQSFLRGGTGLAGRARGGPVHPGTSYVVGERGPEILTMAQGGMVRANGGIVSGSGLAVARKLEAEGLIKKIKALQEAFGRGADQVNKSTDRLRSLVEQRREFAAAATSSFTGSLFGQGTSAGDLKLRLDARRNDANKFRRNLELLRRRRLHKGLWSQLASSSDYGAAAQLAAMTPHQLAAIQQSYVASQQAVGALGAYAGNVQYGAQVAAAQAQQKRDQANLNALAKLLRSLQLQLKTQGNKSYLLINTKG